MLKSSNKLRAQLPGGVGGARRKVLQRSTTYLARIAIVLQDAPDKMLTFTQLMEKMGRENRKLLRENRKSIENNVRVCLSTNKCFVKIPLVPDCDCRGRGGQRNFWKLDLSHITTKMVRRHFQDILDFFPELKGRLKFVKGNAATPPPPPVQISCEVKFSGPFSIESLLKRDSPASARTLTNRTSPLPSEPVQSEHHHHHLPNHLYRYTPRVEKHRPGLDAEDRLPVRYRSSVSCPAGGAAQQKMSKRLCTGSPLPTFAVNNFNQLCIPYPTCDPHYIRL
ncbi:forkhead box protein H1-like [Vanacampus margaritifer]